MSKIIKSCDNMYDALMSACFNDITGEEWVVIEAMTGVLSWHLKHRSMMGGENK